MTQLEARADTVRAFNRFYTRRIGALGQAHLGSPFSLTEVRVLYELAHRQQPTAVQIADALGLDRGQLSRTLRVFRRRRLITTRRSTQDLRRSHLSLTAAGRRAFAPLDQAAREGIIELLRPLGARDQRRVLEAMRTIRGSLGPLPDETPGPWDVSSPESRSRARPGPYVLRAHQPGDMGWVVHRHGVLYNEEFGYDDRFEALVARVVAEFIQRYDPKRERCWIAERDGEIAGSVFVVAKSKTVAKLRLLLVEPSARGLGLGARLVDEVIRFARRAGYKKITLWTQRELASARKIYKAKGFKLVSQQRHRMFGPRLTAEIWDLAL